MIKWFLTAVAVLSFTCLSFAQQPSTKFSLKSDKTKFQPCHMVKVTVDGGGKNVLWRCDGELNDSETDGKVFRFIASPKATTITIRAYSATADGEVVEAVLVIEADGPTPPPIPPLPTDPLVLELRKLVIEGDAANIKKLAALYKLMVAEASKEEYKTAVDLNAIYRQSVTNLVGDNILIAIRTRLSEEIMRIVPADPDTPLNAESRKQLTELFQKLSKVCSEI